MTPALKNHQPRELTDVLIADRERLRKFIKLIQVQAAALKLPNLWKLCELALKGEDAP